MSEGVRRMLRKHHRKSRTGCLNCKKRKVKCDEQKPACVQCLRLELQCPFSALHDPGTSTTSSASIINGATPSGTATPISISSQPLALAPDHTQAPLNAVHLELLYNFVTLTSSTLSHDETIKILWQTNVVTAGFSCDYVMLSILASSALHLAVLKTDQHHFYFSQATSLHHAALSKGSLAISNVTSEKAECLCLFAALTFHFALARPRMPGDFLIEGESGLAEWLVMFRGMRTVVESTNESALHTGPLGPMFKAGTRRAVLQLLAPMQVDHLGMLQRLINETISNCEELHVYNLAIEELRQAFNFVYNQNTHLIETADVFRWLYRISEDYLQLLAQRKPESLAIFAYFCVLLKRFDAMWWIHGLSDHLISQIYNALDEYYRLWINWPMREIGWVPLSKDDATENYGIRLLS